MLTRPVLLLLASIALPQGQLVGQGEAVVTGMVQTDTGGHPLGRALIMLKCVKADCPRDPGLYTQAADTSGWFVIRGITPGVYSRRISYIGYDALRDTVRIASGEHSWGALRLKRRWPPMLIELPVRVSDRPRYRAPDGSISEVQTSLPAPSNPRLWVRVEGNTIVGEFGPDDAGGCAGYHSIEHEVKGDSLVVTLFSSLPQICPSIHHPVLQRFTVQGIGSGTYVTRIFFEGRGGRGSASSGAGPAWAGRLLVP
jgi:hypothetical protein